MSPSSWDLIKNIGLTILPAVVLFAVGAIAHTEWGLLTVLAEPLLLALGMYLLGWSIVSKQPLIAGAAAASLVAGAFSLHEPLADPEPLIAGPSWLRELRGCTLLVKPTTAPVRIVSWTVDGDEGVNEGLANILNIRPDIIIIDGIDDPTIGSHLQQELDGEAKFYKGIQKHHGMMAIVRGSFQYCGGESDEWQIELPSKDHRNAVAVIGFPHVNDVGVIPLMITRMDSPSDLLDWPAWGERIIDSATISSQAIASLGSQKMVLVGSMGAPASSIALAQPLRSAGLSVASVAPNWPTQIWGVPFLTQHALDHVWTGRDWHVQSSQVLPSPSQPRAPIVVDLIARPPR